MAEHPDLWTERTPERYLFDRTPAFGVAREVDRLAEDVVVDPEPVVPRKPTRERGPFVTYLFLPWSYGDREPGDFWHRIRCRLGRHEMCGGHTMHLDGALVFIERRCRWCDAEAS